MAHVKPIKKKLSKDNVYEKEQKAMLATILQIIGLNPDDETSMIRKDLLEPKLPQIEALREQIRTYYSSDVTSQINRAANKEMSTIRAVLKHHGYLFSFVTKPYKKEDGEYTTKSHYYITTI
jgi:hypothetical protein